MDRACISVLKEHDLYDVPLSTRKLKSHIGRTERDMEKIKLFYKNVDGEDTHLIAEGEDIETAAKNAVKEYYVLREIYGEDKLPISNITRMDKIVDK